MTGWMAYALCAGLDPERWFPSTGQSAAAERAKAVCRACPVQPDCLAHALDTEGWWRYGIWGGMSPDERAALAAAARKPRTTRDDICPRGHTRTWRPDGSRRECMECSRIRDRVKTRNRR